MKIKAYLFLYKEGRKTPFKNGYRPMFNVNGKKYSGRISLNNIDELCYPGDRKHVKIDFLVDNIQLKKGQIITFDEGLPIILGEIFIEEIFH